MPRVKIDPRKNFGLRRFLPDLLGEVDMTILSIKVDENKLNNELRVEKLLLESQLKSITEESAPDNKAIM